MTICGKYNLAFFLLIKENTVLWMLVIFITIYMVLYDYSWSLSFSSKDGILLYSILLWEIKFAWVYFWRAHNKPTRDMNDAIYTHRTGDCRVFPYASRNNFFGIGFGNTSTLLFLNQVWLRVCTNRFIYHGSEPSLRLTLPGSCNTFYGSLIFSLSLKISRTAPAKSHLTAQIFYFMPQTTSLLKFHL